MDEGMQIDRSERHDENADSPRLETLHPDSNIKFERREQHAKHSLEIVAIDEGIQIDRSPTQDEKAYSPRIEILHADSNVTFASITHSLKQWSGTAWTVAEIQIH
jgi:hypothetical protein